MVKLEITFMLNSRKFWSRPTVNNNSRSTLWFFGKVIPFSNAWIHHNQFHVKLELKEILKFSHCVPCFFMEAVEAAGWGLGTSSDMTWLQLKFVFHKSDKKWQSLRDYHVIIFPIRAQMKSNFGIFITLNEPIHKSSIV